VKLERLVSEVCEQTDKQTDVQTDKTTDVHTDTDRHADKLIAILLLYAGDIYQYLVLFLVTSDRLIVQVCNRTQQYRSQCCHLAISTKHKHCLILAHRRLYVKR